MATDMELAVNEVEVIEEQIIEEEIIEEQIVEEEIIDENNQTFEDNENETRTQNFLENLIYSLKSNDNKFEQANIWLLCEFVIPLIERMSDARPKNDLIDSKYQTPQLNINDSQRSRIHLCFAINQQGFQSLPLVIYPQKNEDIELNMTQLMRQTSLIEETETGELSEEILIKWLEKFHSQYQQSDNADSKKSIILLNGSNLQLNENQQNGIQVLNYPNNEQSCVYRHLFNKFKETFKQILTEFSIKDNPNSQLALLYIIKQTLRRIINQDSTKICFQEFLHSFQLPNDLCDYQPSTESFLNGSQNEEETQSSDQTYTYSAMNIYFDMDSCINDDTLNQEDGNTTLSTSLVQATPNNQTQQQQQVKFTDQEINEYTQWINYMCSIGCLCVKYTFLRDLNLKLKHQIKSSKEIIAAEKRWSDLIRKNKHKFVKNLFCTNEDLYFMNWFDLDQWKSKYSNLLKDKKITNSSSIWTFDILNFPYALNSSHIRAPERDVSRPRNLKPRVSVIFAFNASGDYIQPFFIYPNNFGDDGTTGSGDTSDLANNECYSQNGYVTSKIFNLWLTTQFIPYLSQTATLKYQPHLLLYCGKLAVFDHQNMKQCLDNNINLFCITHESIMPFNCVFHKNIRKRQCDLLLDSWKKVTAKQGFSYTFKCKTKSLFSNLFMDAFQMCIEELGDFKSKIQSTFVTCHLWQHLDSNQSNRHVKQEINSGESNGNEESNGYGDDENGYEDEEEFYEDEQLNQDDDNDDDDDDDSDEEFIPDKRIIKQQNKDTPQKLPNLQVQQINISNAKKRESSTQLASVAPPAKRPKGRPRKQQPSQPQLPIYHKIDYDYTINDTLNGTQLDNNDTTTENDDNSSQANNNNTLNSNQNDSQIDLDFKTEEEESKSLAEIINTNEEFRNEIKLIIRAEIQKFLHEKHMNLVMHLKVFIHKIIDDFRVKLAELGEFGILENLNQICDELIELYLPQFTGIQFNSMIFDLIKRFFFNFHQYQHLNNYELTEKFIQIYESKMGLQREVPFIENAKIVNYTELLNESKINQKCSMIANAILNAANTAHHNQHNNL